MTASQADPLATIQRIDPIYVDIQQSSNDLLNLRQQILNGQVARDGDAHVKLQLEDGTTYGPEGHAALRRRDGRSDHRIAGHPRAVPQSGWAVAAGHVCPRRSSPRARSTKAILVPQRAVSRDERGNATVMVVGAGNKVEPRTLQTDRTIGDNWLVTGGLKPGDKVIVEGGMMLRPGMPVTPKPFDPNAKPAQPQGPGGAAPAQAK